MRSRQKKRKRKATKELKNLEAAGTDGEGSSTEQLPRIDPVGEGAPREHRKVVRIAREMFTSSIEEDVTGMIMSHTKLRLICMRPGPDRNAF